MTNKIRNDEALPGMTKGCVIPVQTGILKRTKEEVPAFAGMTKEEIPEQVRNDEWGRFRIKPGMTSLLF
jgi:hypothetical protein